MSYQVIARKWRSKNFDELVGQNHIAQTLTNSLRNNRLPHAILFTGPRGTGKTSSARILSKILRCPDVKDQTPCDNCHECKTISLGRSMNVIEIDGASNNGVEAIRELRESVGYMPATGKRKVYIIDEVHMLSTSAFNALLKTLEEPPDHVIFILATTEAQKIPHTISSRCQRFDFRRISTAVICDHLKMICTHEKIVSSKEALWLISKQADGSMRDAQSLLDQIISFSNQKITAESVTDALGLTDRKLISDTIQLLVKKDLSALTAILEKLMGSGIDPVVFAKELLEQVRNLFVVKTAPEKSTLLVDLPDSEITLLKELTQDVSEEDIHLLFDMTLKGVNDLTQSHDPHLVLEMLLARMLKAPQIKDIANFFSTPASASTSLPHPLAKKKLEKSLETNSSKKSKTPTEKSSGIKNFADQFQNPQENKKENPLNENEQKWLNLVKKIKGANPILAAKLENLSLSRLKDKSIELEVPRKMSFLQEQVKNNDFQEKINNYITTFWGPGYSLTINLEAKNSPENSTPKKMQSKVNNYKNKQLEKEVEEHPLVKNAKGIFNTHIVSIKEQKTNIKEDV